MQASEIYCATMSSLERLPSQLPGARTIGRNREAWPPHADPLRSEAELTWSRVVVSRRRSTTSERRRIAFTLVVAGVSWALSAVEQFAGLGQEEYPEDRILRSPLQWNLYTKWDPTFWAIPSARASQVGQSSCRPPMGKAMLTTPGRVKLAFDKDTGEQVAMKIISKAAISDKPDMAQKLDREIAVMKVINHPHVLTMFDVYQTEDFLYAASLPASHPSGLLVLTAAQLPRAGLRSQRRALRLPRPEGASG